MMTNRSGDPVVGSLIGMVLLVCMSVLGCTTPPVALPPSCPPLPLLDKRATQAEIQTHHHTVISMYAQCAGSR